MSLSAYNAAATTFTSPSGSQSVSVTSGRGSGSTATSILAVTSCTPARVSRQYADHATPRPSTSTRFRNAGITLRSSTSISAPYSRISASGCAARRIRSCSYDWPVA